MQKENTRFLELKRIKNEDKLKVLNELMLEFEEKKFNTFSNSFINEMSNEEVNAYIDNMRILAKKIDALNSEINSIMSLNVDFQNMVYLTDVIEKEKPVWGSNNLIISPVGSGKSTLITERLVENEDNHYLLLVSTHSLKESLAPNDVLLRRKYSNRMYTTSNKKIFGDEKYKILVMTYAEFGNKIYSNNDFIYKNKFKRIFCDEIHSLPYYIKIGSLNSSIALAHAQRLLFNKIEGLEIFYFTATKENIITEEIKRKGTLSSIKIFDYSEYPRIMRYVPQATREIKRIEEIKQYLKERKNGFKHYGYKGIVFSKTIKSLFSIEEIVKNEGYNPLVLWSENNSDYKLSEEQKRARKILFETNKIPEPYDFLIFNSALQEGWNLKDSSVKLAIINTTNETEYVQALGRLRRNVDLLIHRSTESEIREEESSIEIKEKWLNKPLTSSDKKELAESINVSYKWPTLKKMIANNYEIEDKNIYIDKKKTRCTVITKKV